MKGKKGFQKGESPWNKDKRGVQKAWNKGIRGLFSWHNISGLRSHKKGEFHHSEEAKKIIKQKRANQKMSVETRQKLRELQLGEKSHFWQGGKTKERERLRKSLEYKLWRESIFTRDNWTCQFCLKRGGKLEVDHIKPWALYPELRFVIDNGRTLCKDCHKTTDTYLNSFGRNQYNLGGLRAAIK